MLNGDDTHKLKNFLLVQTKAAHFKDCEQSFQKRMAIVQSDFLCHANPQTFYVKMNYKL